MVDSIFTQIELQVFFHVQSTQKEMKQLNTQINKGFVETKRVSGEISG